MDSKPLLVDTGKGLSIKYKNRFLYSKYAPISGAKKLINDINLSTNTLYLIPSPLLCYEFNILINKLPPNSKLLFIEIDENLYKISNSTFKINQIKSGFEFIQLLNRIDFSSFKHCKIIQINGTYSILKNDYDMLYKILLNHLHNYWKNRYTETQMGQLWVKNTLMNLRNLEQAKPISTLRCNKHLVVIGAGESTESIIPLLKDNRDQLFILCVDTALQILLEVDIIPDIVLALEAQFYNLPDFYGAKSLNIDIIYDISSYPAIPRILTGNKYYTVTKFSNSILLDKIKSQDIITEFLPPLGSVGITALYVALQLTSGYIFTAGLDFSYTMGKTHSNGTPYHKSALESWTRFSQGDSYINCLKRPIFKQENKIGLKENTDTILYDYSLHAKELLYGNNRVYDLTTQGMNIGAKLCDFVLFKTLIKESVNNTENRTTDSPIAAKSLLINELKNIEKGIKYVSNILNNNNKPDKLLNFLQPIEYLFDHYPENKPLENINHTMLKRIFYTMVRFKRQISSINKI